MDLVLRDAVLSMAHFLTLLFLVGILAAEAAVLFRTVDRRAIEVLARLDVFYGIDAGLLVLAGVCRVIYGVKGSAFYTGNPLFWTKIALFAAVALISIYPTIQFILWRLASRRANDFLPSANEISRVRMTVVVECALFCAIPVFAALMARGIGT